ncbi:MAG: hypothetical protein HOC77_06010 [Chloroflexi bacterium]|jgi:hypothetical protein|nr:hypothetical protein [Chloroflexota bacterium]MBT4073546.1 hypothetical protein [Chloroflexota bacterium]MBT4514629.1 hypothetical protein [Chloroflexota bacterium]MBT5320373.1 hypothetical protein [Chloroflexota bacterium]MBT6681109.1 hypothetical protein [Chloroflexota bacterium]
MPTIGFTFSTTNAALLREALAHHQGVDVGGISDTDVKEFAGRHLRGLVQRYRASQRDSENPLDTSDPLV